MNKTIIIRNHQISPFGAKKENLGEIFTAIPLEDETIAQLNRYIAKHEQLSIRSGEFCTNSITFTMPGHFYYFTKANGIDTSPLFNEKDGELPSFMLIDKPIDEIASYSGYIQTTGARISLSLSGGLTIYNSIKNHEIELISNTIYFRDIEKKIEEKIFQPEATALRFSPIKSRFLAKFTTFLARLIPCC